MDLVGIRGCAPDCNCRARRAAPFTRLYLLWRGLSFDINRHLRGDDSNLLHSALFVPARRRWIIPDDLWNHSSPKLFSTARSRGDFGSVRQLSANAVAPSRKPRSYSTIARISATAWSSTSFTSAYL